MKTAIIILNYNDYDNTSSYINTIKEYNIIDKIIIVDNNSTDNKQEDLKKLQNEKIDVIFTNKNGGYAYGNNFGLTYIKDTYGLDVFKYIIISNPDVSIEENSIVECINEFNNNTAIVAPRMNFVSGPARRSAWKKRTFWIDIANSTRITELILFPLLKKGEYKKSDYNNQKLSVDVIAGSFFVADFKKFNDIDFFDENTFLFYEEDIISNKLLKKGFEIILLNNVKFMHYDSQTIGKVISVKRKMDILFDSKIYYQKIYNNVGKIGILVFEILRRIRKIEIMFEIPIRKLYKKLKR